MDILRHKKAQLPIPPITSTKKKKITSTATIVDSDSVDAAAPAEPGSSTGPGTLTAQQGCSVDMGVGVEGYGLMDD
jgi:hypothetical protein